MRRVEPGAINACRMPDRPPDATLTYPPELLGEMPGIFSWDGPFEAHRLKYDIDEGGTVQLWFGADRRACTEALVGPIDAIRRHRALDWSPRARRSPRHEGGGDVRLVHG